MSRADLSSLKAFQQVLISEQPMAWVPWSGIFPPASFCHSAPMTAAVAAATLAASCPWTRLAVLLPTETLGAWAPYQGPVSSNTFWTLGGQCRCYLPNEAHADHSLPVITILGILPQAPLSLSCAKIFLFSIQQYWSNECIYMQNSSVKRLSLLSPMFIRRHPVPCCGCPMAYQECPVRVVKWGGKDCRSRRQLKQWRVFALGLGLGLSHNPVPSPPLFGAHDCRMRTAQVAWVSSLTYVDILLMF